MDIRGAQRMVGIKELVDAGLQEVPPIYIRPPQERPNILPHLDDQQHADGLQIPILDLTHLVSPCTDTISVEGGVAAARSLVVQKIGQACKEWGFFQVINHGVDNAVIQALREAALAFFSQPAEERMKLHTQSFRCSVKYSTSFNPNVEKIREWRDGLLFNRFPGECDGFQEAPDICRMPLLKYIDGVEKLANVLYGAIFESLGLTDPVRAGVPNIPRVLMGINYYPPCPNPSLTLGVSSHSDVSCLTVLHPDFDVPGLQVRKGDKWVSVGSCHPSAFVVNLADQLEILTNGMYRSIEHRVVTNSAKPRMSIACFFGPSEDTIVAPLQPLVSDDGSLPLFKPTRFGDYIKNFTRNRLLADRRTLDFAKA